MQNQNQNPPTRPHPLDLFMPCASNGPQNKFLKQWTGYIGMGRYWSIDFCCVYSSGSFSSCWYIPHLKLCLYNKVSSLLTGIPMHTCSFWQMLTSQNSVHSHQTAPKQAKIPNISCHTLIARTQDLNFWILHVSKLLFYMYLLLTLMLNSPD